MRKILAVLMLLMFCGAACADEFPKLGRCLGDSVRLREKPGTKGKIIGRADIGTQLVILGEGKSAGEKWYRVDHPYQKGSAWIHSRYVNIAYGNESAFLDVRQTFGIYPDKTRALFGAPERVVEDKFSSTDRDAFYYDYPGFRVWFDLENQNLMYVFVEQRGPAIYGVRVGDMALKLIELGMPESKLNLSRYDDGDSEYETWNYELSNGEKISFGISLNDKDEAVIDSVNWYRGDVHLGQEE